MSRPAEIVGGSISSLLPIKCFLDSQSYAPFIINMLLPLVVIALAALVLVPTTLVEHALRAHRNDPGVEAPAFKGKFNIPDFLACWRVLRQPMTESDVAAWRAPFIWKGRLAGVAVFALFFLYPTLVASIASIFNCSAPVSGKRYLLADLTVVCNEGGHIALVFFACIGGAVYAVGIPVAVVIATALKTPIVCHGAVDAETRRRPWARPRCVCARRDQAKYAAADVRTRFGFLYHGYATDRSGAIVAWEALVMLRKLAITLVGSAVSDVRSMRSTCRCCPARGGIRVPLFRSYVSLLSAHPHLHSDAFPRSVALPHTSRTSRSSGRSSSWWRLLSRRRSSRPTRSTSSTRSTSPASSPSSSRRSSPSSTSTPRRRSDRSWTKARSKSWSR